jgi:hypothetical protein
MEAGMLGEPSLHLWGDVGADDVDDLLLELRIVRDLEGPDEMRLEAGPQPDVQSRRVRNAHGFRHRAETARIRPDDLRAPDNLGWRVAVRDETSGCPPLWLIPSDRGAAIRHGGHHA